MTRLSVCSLGVSCNEMIDTPMLLVVVSLRVAKLTRASQTIKSIKSKEEWSSENLSFELFYIKIRKAENSLVLL